MIILNLKDGLGNQLFEYAYARWLQEKYCDKLAFNNYYFDGKKRRAYSLNHFKLNPNIIHLNKWQQRSYNFRFLIRLMFCYRLDFFKWITSKNRPKGLKKFLFASQKGLYVSFDPFLFFPFKKSNKKNKYIYGNFECYSYFKDIENILRDELEIIDEPNKENAKLIDEIDSSESVCVHIRRGDYLDEKWSYLNVCNDYYYESAIKMIQKQVHNPTFFIFSNSSEDIIWIKRNYKIPRTARYIDLNNPDYEDFRLMCHCKHFIISNSTFSWWASFLSKNKDKIIIAPNKWENNSNYEEFKGIYMDNWIKVSTDYADE